MTAAKLRRMETRARRKGLLWSSNAATRTNAGQAGLRAVTVGSALDASDLRGLLDTVLEGEFSLMGIASELMQSFPSRKEKNEAFRQAWNQVIRDSQSETTPEPSRARGQVDIGAVSGGRLPSQTMENLQPTGASSREMDWSKWALPALGLVAVLIIARGKK